MTYTVAFLAANTLPVGDAAAERIIEAWVPYRDLFDLLWSGRRHVRPLSTTYAAGRPLPVTPRAIANHTQEHREQK